MEMITIKDVARLCGVGVSTVSRAINNHPDINEETRDKIMQVIRENHYIPNNSARNLKRSGSKTIAVLIKGISNPFFGKMIKVFEEEIQKKKYSFILQKVDEKEDEVDVAIELVKEKKLKGIVFLGGYFTHSQEKLNQLVVPFVLSTTGLAGNLEECSYSAVSVDNFQESYRIVDYLCRAGHTKIAIIAARPDDVSIGRLRLDGYKKALEDHGLLVDSGACFYSHEELESYTMENGYAVMNEIMDSERDFTAVYAISDSMAVGACKAVFDRGKKVPEDYSVAGFDGLDIARYYHPSITTIRQPAEEMAYETIRILFDLIKNKAQNQQIVFQAKLEEGQSARNITE